METTDSLWAPLLRDLWNKPLSVTFRNDYLDGTLRDKNVTKPRCPGGPLVEIARMPDEEDNISLVRFDEKLLRKAFQPSNVSVTEPSWLQHEQPLRIASDLKKAHKRKSKRKRDKDAPNPTTEETSAQKKVKLEQTANA